MGLKKMLLLGLICISSVAVAQNQQYDETKFYTIKTVEVKEIKHDLLLDTELQKIVSTAIFDETVPGNRLESTGKIIGMARDLVALGEDVYRLVSHGKPNVNTSYEPISVIPKVDGRAVDLFETESWSMPEKRTYELNLKNLYNATVVSFRYSVIYSYNGSYNGKGAYLTSAQIVPDYLNVLWGFDFTATMKLGGIQNQGTRENPIAGATLILQYTVSNVVNSRTIVDTFFVTGNGGFKKL